MEQFDVDSSLQKAEISKGWTEIFARVVSTLERFHYILKPGNLSKNSTNREVQVFQHSAMPFIYLFIWLK